MSRYTALGPRGAAAARVIAGFASRPLGSYRDLAAYGDIVEMPLYPGRRLFVVSRPEYAEHVLAKKQDNYVKAFTYRPLRVFLGSGLLFGTDLTDEAVRLGRAMSRAQRGAPSPTSPCAPARAFPCT